VTAPLLSLTAAARQSGLTRGTLVVLLRAGALQSRATGRSRTLDRADLALLQALRSVPRPLVRRTASRIAALRRAGHRVAAFGGRIVLTERDGSLWDIESGQRLLPLPGVPAVLVWTPRGAVASLPPPRPPAEPAPTGVDRRAPRDDPTSAALALRHGMALHRLRRWPAAERAYARAIALDPRLAEAHRQLALLLIETGRAQRALRVAQAWRRLTRREPPAT
jgi:tetratricopeptide (TPR) repeat protein